jgi:hypothetical protein
MWMLHNMHVASVCLMLQAYASSVSGVLNAEVDVDVA